MYFFVNPDGVFAKELTEVIDKMKFTFSYLSWGEAAARQLLDKVRSVEQ